MAALEVCAASMTCGDGECDARKYGRAIECTCTENKQWETIRGSIPSTSAVGEPSAHLLHRLLHSDRRRRERAQHPARIGHGLLLPR